MAVPGAFGSPIEQPRPRGPQVSCANQAAIFVTGLPQDHSDPALPVTDGHVHRPWMMAGGFDGFSKLHGAAAEADAR